MIISHSYHGNNNFGRYSRTQGRKNNNRQRIKRVRETAPEIRSMSFSLNATIYNSHATHLPSPNGL